MEQYGKHKNGLPTEGEHQSTPLADNDDSRYGIADLERLAAEQFNDAWEKADKENAALDEAEKQAKDVLKKYKLLATTNDDLTGCLARLDDLADGITDRVDQNHITRRWGNSSNLLGYEKASKELQKFKTALNDIAQATLGLKENYVATGKLELEHKPQPEPEQEHFSLTTTRKPGDASRWLRGAEQKLEPSQPNPEYNETDACGYVFGPVALTTPHIRARVKWVKWDGSGEEITEHLIARSFVDKEKTKPRPVLTCSKAKEQNRNVKKSLVAKRVARCPSKKLLPYYDGSRDPKSFFVGVVGKREMAAFAKAIKERLQSEADAFWQSVKGLISKSARLSEPKKEGHPNVQPMHQGFVGRAPNRTAAMLVEHYGLEGASPKLLQSFIDELNKARHHGFKIRVQSLIEKYPALVAVAEGWEWMLDGYSRKPKDDAIERQRAVISATLFATDPNLVFATDNPYSTGSVKPEEKPFHYGAIWEGMQDYPAKCAFVRKAKTPQGAPIRVSRLFNRRLRMELKAWKQARTSA